MIAPIDLPKDPSVYYIPIDRIEPNPFQPRQTFSQAELEELAQSIREHGVLQPILVRPHPEKEGWYQLVSGERRVKACNLAGRSEIRGTVRPLSDLQSAQLSLEENIQRQTLTDWEEARGIERLWAMFEKSGQPMSKAKMAKALGKSISYISNRLDALGYHGDVQDLLSRHQHVLSSARAINSVPDEDLRAKYVGLVDEGKSFIDVTAEIQRDQIEIKAKSQSQRAPEQQTQSRINSVSAGQTGSVSRGRQLTGGTSRNEANSEVRRALGILASYVTLCDSKAHAEAVELARRILRGDLSR